MDDGAQHLKTWAAQPAAPALLAPALLALAVLSGGLLGCGSSAAPDGGVDASADAGGMDAGADAGMDAGLDAGLDAGADAGTDAGLDAGTDGGVDANLDAGPPPELRIAPRFVSDSLSGCVYASPITVDVGGETLIGAFGHYGGILGLDPDTGATRIRRTLSRSADASSLELLGTPAPLPGGGLLAAWGELSGSTRLRHVAAVLDLSAADALDPRFTPLTFAASLPTYDGLGAVAFEAEYQRQRSAQMLVPVADRSLGVGYVAFGNGPSVQPFHGWLFELDMDAWAASGPSSAVSGTLLTTAENDCGAPGSAATDLCGGGIWTSAGIQRVDLPDGSYELLLPTGNGRVDLDRGAYAHSVMRTRRGLAFARSCDEALCTPFDERAPDPACLRSCRDLFVPRLMPGEPPLRPEDGSCDGLNFIECYAALDADLGANAPAVLEVPGGPRVVVQPGKDGALYLFDYAHMGTMVQRLQVMSFCGGPASPCRATWMGTFVTHPAVATVDGVPHLILASQMADRAHPSGITAVRVLMRGGEPRMELAWQVPDFSSFEATQLFRHHPGRPVVYEVGGEPFVLLVEPYRNNLGFLGMAPGRLWVIRVRDGALMARQDLAASGVRYAQPLIHNDVLYVPSCATDQFSGGRIEAFDLMPVLP